jgi:CubicO group peptidase (beta-lactamase class C family)
MKRLLAMTLLSFIVGIGAMARVNQQKPEGDARKRMSDAEIADDLKKYLDELVTQDRFSGAVLLAKDGVPIFTQASGLASRSFNIPNRVDTKFNLGSMNKMFTAVAIAQLAEQGKLSFDDPIIKHWPDYPNKAVAEKVTIHHLLTHTSGMGSYFNETYRGAAKDRFKKVQDYLPLFVNDPLAFEPGQRWQYSNSGFMALGALVERVSGQDYFDYVREHIYKPAGMINTDAYELDHDTPNLAIGYTREESESGPRKNNLYLHVVKGGPAGGGFSTVEDLLKFDIALRQHKLLSPKYTEIILTGKVETGGPSEKYAYGFMDRRVGGARIVGHSGGFPGINSQLDMYLDLGYTVAVMSNYDPPAASRIATRLQKRITGMPILVPITLAPEVLKKNAGKYETDPHSQRHFVIEITVENNELWISFPGGERHKFVPLSQSEFFDEDFEDVRLTFIKDDKGTITSLNLVGAGPAMTARKVQ